MIKKISTLLLVIFSLNSYASYCPAIHDVFPLNKKDKMGYTNEEKLNDHLWHIKNGYHVDITSDENSLDEDSSEADSLDKDSFIETQLIYSYYHRQYYVDCVYFIHHLRALTLSTNNHPNMYSIPLAEPSDKSTSWFIKIDSPEYDKSFYYCDAMDPNHPEVCEWKFDYN